GVNGSGATNGGHVHGNRMGVPVAGGSGGGSSNPKFVAGGCGSAGGGGGGALALFSMDVLNGNIVEAIGGNAESVTPVAGSGSGGYIELGAKVQKSFGGTGNVSGGATGSAGGRGRARYDGGFIPGAPTFGAAIPFIGPTIDTLTYVQSKTFAVSGTYGGATTEPVQLYMRGDVGNWTLVPGVTFTGRTWSVNVTVTGGKGNYYFAALQTVAAPSSAAYLNEPSYVLSQVAANIVVVDLIPKINVDRTTITFKDIVCEPNMVDSVKIWNSGDDTLKITPTFANGATADFSLLQPIPPIAPNVTVWAYVRFAPTTPGTKSVDFVLTNNDPRPGKNPTIIKLTGRKLNFQPSLAPTSRDFGDVCMDSTTSFSFNFNYTGDIPDTIVAITRLGTGPAAFTITGPTIPVNGLIFLNPTSSGTIVVRFRPPSVGIFVDSFRVLTKPCNLPLTFTVRGRGYANSIEVTPNPLDFGQVRVGQTATTPGFTVKNTGTLDGTITDTYITPAGSPFVVAPSLNGTLIPAGGSVPGTVSFKPISSGPFNAQLCVVFGTTCRDTECVVLKGEGVTSLLVLSRKKITLSADSCADVPPSVTDTFKLYNRGTAAVQIDAATAVNGLAMLSPSKPIPGSLAAGDSILFTVTWSPGGAGAEQFKILTQAEDPSQQVMLVDATLRRERGGIDLLKGDGSPLPSAIDLGNIFDCTTGGKNYQLSIRNTGTLAEDVTASFVAGGIFSLSPASPYAIPTGGKEDITLGFNSGPTGDFTDTLLIREGVCGRETRIPVTGHRYSVSFATTGIAFGNSNVGVAKTGTATAQNTSDPKTPSNVKVNIAGVFIRQTGNEFAIVQPTGLPKGLATNEAATVDVTFTPSGQTSYSAQICFYTDSPCPDTICKSLTGTGIMSSIVVRQSSVNFGTRYICQDSVTTISIRNSGSAPLNVLGLDIGGVDASAFQELTGLTFPVTISPADSIMIKLRFNPAGASSDGLKNGTLTIRSDDAAQPSIVVSLIGERRRQALSTPNQLDFGRVDVGTTVLDTLTLENRTSAPMRIESFTLGAPFVIVSPLGALTIAPFDSVKVVVRFAPADSNAAASTLVGIASSPCVDTTRVSVTGRGRIQQIGIATILIPDSLHAKAGDRIAIPIVLSSGSNLKESQATTFSATVRFNASMLLPLGVRGRGEPLLKGSVISVGSITSSKVVGNERVVTFQITNSQLPTAPDTLGFLDARAALGDSIITPITIDTLFWTDGKVNTTTRGGSFTLDGYCVAGGTRLFRLTGGFGIKAAVPNPFNPATVITFETAELGPTSLAIYDLYGGLVEMLVDRRSMPIGSFDAVWHAETYSSGVYYAVLTSPTQRSIQQLVLVK
ncbi:MAG: choice-of-anchor D domain-containing protein, partial [Candidatus Kapaibacterium sp.]